MLCFIEIHIWNINYLSTSYYDLPILNNPEIWFIFLPSLNSEYKVYYSNCFMYFPDYVIKYNSKSN